MFRVWHSSAEGESKERKDAYLQDGSVTSPMPIIVQYTTWKIRCRKLHPPVHISENWLKSDSMRHVVSNSLTSVIYNVCIFIDCGFFK